MKENLLEYCILIVGILGTFIPLIREWKKSTDKNIFYITFLIIIIVLLLGLGRYKIQQDEKAKNANEYAFNNLTKKIETLNKLDSSFKAYLLTKFNIKDSAGMPVYINYKGKMLNVQDNHGHMDVKF